METCPEPVPSYGTHLVAALIDASLPRHRWNHEAHLVVARELHRALGASGGALGELRGLITAYNARSGMPAHRVICHETVTRYFFGAVVALDHLRLETMLAHPWCTHSAPLRHWSPERLSTRRPPPASGCRRSRPAADPGGAARRSRPRTPLTRNWPSQVSDSLT